MTDAILEISDGTTTVNLINPSSGFHLVSWEPATTGYKGGGVFQDPPLADWRQLRTSQWENAQEGFTLHVNGANPDNAALKLQQLRQLLEKANQYWTTDWQNTPVYIAAKAKCETNTRYAIIAKGRLPSDKNYFSQPFTGQKATMRNLSLQIERRAWLSNVPGTGTATNISAVQYYDNQWCIDFSGASDEIDCGSDASIDNLPSGANGFTAEAWVNTRSIGGSNGGGRIFDKLNWSVGISGASNISLFVNIVAATTTAESNSTIISDLFDEWHHIALTYNNNTDRLVYVWVDGAEITYEDQIAASGALTSDAANNFFIGNNAANTRNFDGCIAWCRLSDTIRYTTTFSPPELCSPPAIDGNTVAQWNMTEGSGATVDNAEGTAASDGTITGATWASDVNYEGCGRAYGNVDSSGDREVTTAKEVFVGNKYQLANITDIYNYDASLTTFSSNLLDAALPITLFPATAAINDIIYFGINTVLPDSGPFDSLVFDIATVAASTTSFTLIWEYWNGATWTTLSTRDNTNSFQDSGVNSIHWTRQSNWATTSINSITAYWVRVRISALTGTFTNPTQQNRDIYSISWNYFEIQESEIKGDIIALPRIKIFNRSSASNSIDKIIISLRTLSRGDKFIPYLNADGGGIPPGISISLGSDTSSQTRVNGTATGSVARFSATDTTTIPRITYQFSNKILSHYRGKFRAYLLYAQEGGVSGELSVDLRILSSLGTLFTSETVNLTPASTSGASYPSIADLGEIDFPYISGITDGDLINDQRIIINAGNENGGGTPGDLDIVALYLSPIDEWVGEFLYHVTSSGLIYTRYLDIGMIPTNTMRSLLIDTSTEKIIDSYDRISSPMFVQSNQRQRLFFLSIREQSGPRIEFAHALQMEKNQQYLSLRGSS